MIPFFPNHHHENWKSKDSNFIYFWWDLSGFKGSDLQIKVSKNHDYRSFPFLLHGIGIFTYIWLKFMVNVGRYSIRGISLKSLIFNVILWWSDRLLQPENLGVLTQFSRKDWSTKRPRISGCPRVSMMKDSQHDPAWLLKLLWTNLMRLSFGAHPWRLTT